MNKLSLTDREWKEFVIEDIFEVKRGTRYVKSKQKPGDYPYISSTAFNNGVDNFTVPTKRNKLYKGFVGINNSGSVGVAFYHPYEAVVSDHVTMLKNEYITNMYIGLFIATVLESCNQNRYSFNYEMNNNRLKRSKIILPVKSEGSPDYEFMEAYMKQIEKTIDCSLLKELDSKAEKYNTLTLDNITWKEYTIEDAFESVESSPYSWDYNALDEKVKKEKEIPYVTRTSRNNGVSSFIKDLTDEGFPPIEGNCLTIGLDTGTVNYQPGPFYTGQNIHIVRHSKFNKHNALFIIPLIEQSLEKFGWGGFSATLGRFRKTKIMLPSNDDGIDWGFMERYIKSLPHAELL